VRVTIVGGGIAGLSAAYHLEQGSRAAGIELECTLVEKDTRLGGKVVTNRRDGFVVEGGPDSFLTQKPWAVDLCRKIGLEGQLVGTNEASRRVFILWNGKLRKLPDGVLLVVPTRFAPFALSTLISPLGKLRMGMDLFIPRRGGSSDESVADFVRRRLGSEALDKIAEPLMGGIHTSDPERQSLLATFPRFADIERKHGSLIKGMLAGRGHRPAGASKPLPTFMSLRGGLEQLTETVAARLGPTRVLTGRTVQGISRDADGRFALRLDDGATLEADAVVLANPAKMAAELVEGMDGALAGRLRTIRYVSTATVSFGFRQAELGHDLQGFGFVIPSKERRAITGCTWSSTKFDGRAPERGALIRCFLGSAVDDSSARFPEDEMVRVARAELKSIMRVTADPVETWVYPWKDGHPQYDVGHLDLMASIDAMIAARPGLHLIGSSYRGIGLPDCIRGGQAAAEAIVRKAAGDGGRAVAAADSNLHSGRR